MFFFGEVSMFFFGRVSMFFFGRVSMFFFGGNFFGGSTKGTWTFGESKLEQR
jgi:hypothetical protein